MNFDINKVYEQVNALEVNDFDGFDEILFSEEELNMTPERRWEKYYSFSDEEDLEKENLRQLTIYIPSKPVTFKEHHLCHYIMWNCIGYSKSEDKPLTFRNFTTLEWIIPPMHICYACAWSFKKRDEDAKKYYKEKRKYVFCDCKYCPIWSNTYNYRFQCEVGEENEVLLEKNRSLNDYYKWSSLCYGEESEENEKIGEILKEHALKIARYPWIEK